MKRFHQMQSGFTIIEIAIVLLIVTILLGYTVALFPVQQELKQYRAAETEMDEILQAIVGFAQANGRLPCPSEPNTNGIESGGGTANCNLYGGFLPVNTLGLTGKLNADTLLLDPWGNPYRYYVTDSDYFEDDTDADVLIDDDLDGDPDGDGISDFVNNGEMKDVGLADNAIDEDNDGTNEIESDGYLDLDPNLIICDQASANADRCDALNEQVMGEVDTNIPMGPGNYSAAADYTAYAGVPVVILSMGKNWAETPTGDELENRGSSQTTTDLGLTAGPSGNEYFLDTDTVFVKRITGAADDFDDIVKWISPNLLYSKMIEAGQLP